MSENAIIGTIALLTFILALFLAIKAFNRKKRKLYSLKGTKDFNKAYRKWAGEKIEKEEAAKREALAHKGMKQCPACSSWIDAGAVKCPYCWTEQGFGAGIFYGAASEIRAESAKNKDVTAHKTVDDYIRICARSHAVFLFCFIWFFAALFLLSAAGGLGIISMQ